MLRLKYIEPYDDENWTDEFMVSLLVICKKSYIKQDFPSETTIRLTTVIEEEITSSGDSAVVGVVVTFIFAFVIAALVFAYFKFKRRLGGQKTEQKAPDLVATLP